MIYLATPYAHESPFVREQRFGGATEYAAYLMRQRQFVFSPITHCHPLSEFADLPLDWNYWKSYDLWFLRNCDQLHVLAIPGWSTSIGVTAEIKHAEEWSIPVRYINSHYKVIHIKNYLADIGGHDLQFYIRSTSLEQAYRVFSAASPTLSTIAAIREIEQIPPGTYPLCDEKALWKGASL